MPAIKEEQPDIQIFSPMTTDPAPTTQIRDIDVGIRRMVLDYVEVPTLGLLKQRYHRGTDKQLKNLAPQAHTDVKKIKIKKLNNNIDLDTINRRLAVLGPAGERDLEVKLPGNVECTAFPRAFFSDTWGGGRLATGPAIGEQKMREHNFRNFLYPTTDYCPASICRISSAAPMIAGAAGLMFSPNGVDNNGTQQANKTVRLVITKLPQQPVIWLYVGQYLELPAPSLTRDEWLSQKLRVKQTWAQDILKKGWGRIVRTRVFLRKHLGREPTLKEVEEYNDEVTVTADEIREDFDQGKERLGVFVLKPVGYNEEFQQQNCERFPAWNEIERAKPKTPRVRKINSQGRTPKTTQQKKISAGSELGNREAGLEDNNVEIADEEGHRERELNYIPRGT
ncbi:hypothetical protein HWV62_44762 [Athelia sp. TMB]|nr:hypothetical protein HWV62_44762 [Athelia sp. TMB]